MRPARIKPLMRERRLSAVGLVLGAACSVQGGAAVAKSLFPQLGPPGVVFLRLLFGALALWAIARPQIRGRSRADLQLVAVLGVVLVSMNLCFYEAIARLPLGIAVTVEFLGPLAVAVLLSRRLVDLVWVALAGSGVALLAEGGGKNVHATGIVLAATAGLFWALYILLSVRVGRRWPGPTGLAPAMVVGGLLALPWGIISAGRHLGDAQLVGAAVGVGLLSSALPWSLELEALRRLPPAVFSVVLSLEPAVAALAGFVFLHEHLRSRAWIAIGMVVLASAGAARRRPPVAPVDA
ncbi:MAG TPA: EamA family transporter [Gaiellaceae bacterium]|nr:EamA family transporter [Gaiellaceae bacterium]